MTCKECKFGKHNKKTEIKRYKERMKEREGNERNTIQGKEN